MLFGGTAGLNGFFPDRLEEDPHAPQVAITDFRLFNRSLPLAAREFSRGRGGDPWLTLSARDAVFGFEFAALHFAKPEKNRYRYQLEGFNESWIETDARNRFAQYTNLDAGDYVFRVRAANADGLWSEDGAVLHVRMLPAPWRAWWAKVAYFAVLTALMFSYVRWQRLQVAKERAVVDRERAANELLREANRLKDEFLANSSRLLLDRERLIGELEARNSELALFNYTVAHDLKNPLTTIKNFIGLARLDAAEGKTGRLEEDFDRLQTAADQLHSLFDELFKLSQVGVKVNPPQNLAFGDLVRATLSSLEGVVAERGAVVEVAPELPSVWGDRLQLEELVWHLIQNALVYVDSSRVPRIEIGVRQEAGVSIFYVADNGIGIDPQYHEKVFGLFERLNPTASKGTGVGLALAKRIVEAHGGRIWVESVGTALPPPEAQQGRGPGSTLCFTLEGR